MSHLELSLSNPFVHNKSEQGRIEKKWDRDSLVVRNASGRAIKKNGDSVQELTRLLTKGHFSEQEFQKAIAANRATLQQVKICTNAASIVSTTRLGQTKLALDLEAPRLEFNLCPHPSNIQPTIDKIQRSLEKETDDCIEGVLRLVHVGENSLDSYMQKVKTNALTAKDSTDLNMKNHLIEKHEEIYAMVAKTILDIQTQTTTALITAEKNKNEIFHQKIACHQKLEKIQQDDRQAHINNLNTLRELESRQQQQQRSHGIGEADSL